MSIVVFLEDVLGHYSTTLVSLRSSGGLGHRQTLAVCIHQAMRSSLKSEEQSERFNQLTEDSKLTCTWI
jgi:hypothetical protein